MTVILEQMKKERPELVEYFKNYILKYLGSEVLSVELTNEQFTTTELDEMNLLELNKQIKLDFIVL